MSEREKILRDLYNTERSYRNNVKSNVDENLPYIEPTEKDYDLFKSEFEELENHLKADYYWTQIYLNPDADSYTNLTEASNEPPLLSPNPSITSVSYPDSVKIGNKANITVKVKNNGIDAPLQSIAASFPAVKSAQNISLKKTQFSNQSYGQVYAPGMEVGSSYGHDNTTLSYPLVEIGGEWKSDKTKSMTVQLTPQQPGEFPIYVKSIAQNGGWAADPEISLDTTRDQQSEAVDVHTLIATKSGPAPTAVFTGPSPQVRPGQQVTFDASNSTDEDGSITEYAWDFNGNGAIDKRTTSPRITHTFSESGKKSVSLTVYDDSGYNSTTTSTVTVNAKPTASFRVSSTNPVTWNDITFNASASNDPDGDISRYEWDIDEKEFDWESGKTVESSFRTTKTYTIYLRVTDSLGGTDTAQTEIKVKPPVSATEMNIPKPVSYDEPTEITGTVVNNGGSETEYSFALVAGDDHSRTAEKTGALGAGETTEIRFNHTFINTGNTEITLFNTNHPISSADLSVNATVTADPSVRVRKNPDNPVISEPVELSAAQSFDLDGNIKTIQWDLDNDRDFETTGSTQTHTFSDPGAHSYRVRLVDNSGATTTTRKQITVNRANDWPSAGFGAARSSWNPHTTGPINNVEPVWTTHIGYDVQSPVVINSTVYGVATNGQVVAANKKTGSVEWSRTISPSVEGAPAVWDDTLLIPIKNESIYPSQEGVIALNRQTGEKRWQSTGDWFSSGFVGSPVAVTDGLVFPSGDSIALNVTTGKTVWQTGWSGDGVTADDGFVFFSDSGGEDVVARDAVNGSIAWQANTPDNGSIGIAPAVANGTVFIGDRSANAIDASTGKIKWSTPLGEDTEQRSTPAVTDDSVYFSTANMSEDTDAPGGRLYAVDRTTGTIEWTTTYPKWGVSSPSVAGGTVYVGSYACEQSCSGTYTYPDGKIWAFDADTGDELWNYTTDEYISTAPAISNGSIYIGNGSQGLLAIRDQITNTTTGSKELKINSINTSTPITAGEEITFMATIENTGGESESTTVSLTDNTLGNTKQDVTVSAGEKSMVNLTLQTARGDAGTYTPTVTVGEDTETASIIIKSAMTDPVQIENPSLSPSSISSSSPTTHNLTFKLQNVSADGESDVIDISLPDSVTVESVGTPQMKNAPYNIEVLSQGDPIELEVNPDQSAETVEFVVNIPLELSTNNN
jgi:outer membrane protein assembly factor BamB